MGERVGIDAVQREGVKVDIQVERRTASTRRVRCASRAKLGRETLDEGHRAALLGAQVPLPSRTSAKLCEQGSDECAKPGARELRVVGTAVSERQHPLADRDLGQHAIDELRSGLGHASAAT